MRAFWTRHPRLSRAVDLVAMGIMLAAPVATLIHAAPLLWR